MILEDLVVYPPLVMDNYHLSQQLVPQGCKQEKPKNQNLMINGTIHMLLMTYQNSCEVMLLKLSRFLFVFLGGAVSLYVNTYVDNLHNDYLLLHICSLIQPWYHISA